MLPDHPKPFYYLENFQLLLDHVASRYADLLQEAERDFLHRFPPLPQAAQALLVRMVMRKGELFRASKLDYSEIGPSTTAWEPLAEAGWIELDPPLELAELFSLLTRPELAQCCFRDQLARSPGRKADQLAALSEHYPQARPLAEWGPLPDRVCRLTIQPLCDRLRLMFFGNLRQDWSEFVLADLGVFQYEKVPLSPESRGFRSRADVDCYLAIDDCRRQLDEGVPLTTLAETARALVSDNPWLQRRRARLLFRLAQQQEQSGQLEEALELYRDAAYPGARARCVRVLERLERTEAAHALAQLAREQPESEAERQQMRRTLPRLCRRLGLPRPEEPTLPAIPESHLTLPRPAGAVELAVRDHLHRPDAPVHYVENTLLTALFGLLCWPALFAPLPGAFFHPFHAAPADLLSPDFLERRRELFEDCLAQLNDGRHRTTIREHFQAKQGIQSPFVIWPALDAEKLELALRCIAPAHLERVFRRILDDLGANRAGLPDLIRFWPDESRYELIEVKGPGDRLQDNQIRWLHYCLEHGLPVQVCYVEWATP
ncbi:VRR-NUC domain-containing protein [Chitinimonas lacunae]|uniref:phosphodiesterase I n=1 Tax=Chitinimonas lacunae TaxID=1963018 RepID=A0ABV8MN01_9NEIS